MRILLFLTLAVTSFTADAQLFKYSTFYISGDASSPIVEPSRYMMNRQTGELTDMTAVNPFNYKYSFGIRKIARFDYENKAKNFYDGDESSVNNYAPVGAVEGSEYLLSCELSRNRGMQFVNHEYWYRHVGKYYVAKAEYVDNQEIQLKTFGGELRGKVSFRGFNVTAGVKHRSHPVYGINPFEDNFDLETDAWWSIAYDLGYTDEYWYYDGEGNDVDDYYDYYNWNWFTPDGTQVATTDEEFMKYHFGGAVSTYNDNQLKQLGMQQELSTIFGVSYYYYSESFWLHTWMDVLPHHIGLSEYAYVNMDIPGKTDVDFNTGLIMGAKVSKRLGAFIEARYQRYWDIDNYQLKAGINYSIF